MQHITEYSSIKQMIKFDGPYFQSSLKHFVPKARTKIVVKNSFKNIYTSFYSYINWTAVVNLIN